MCSSFLAGKSDKVGLVYLFNLDLEEGFVGAVRSSLKTKAQVLQGQRAQRALPGSESWSFRAERNGFKKPDGGGSLVSLEIFKIMEY